ncbi:MAG: hypothetical protein HC769_07175 [Cyanobacteria bacterium CRU_2_1]|nr:hypothetical protein [Cyanobacteria bacterium CRU_2_1]
MTHNLKTLADKRNALLLAEIAAWLHMLGKFHEGFLNNPQSGVDIQIPSDLTESFTELDRLLRDPSWSGLIWSQLGISEFQSSSVSFFDFIEKHREQEPKKIAQGLVRLMNDAHGRGSGIEKGVLSRFATSQSGKVYLSTAFGTERSDIDLKQTERHKFYDYLQKISNNCQIQRLTGKNFVRILYMK